jgi:excisionase family DNA binding protein
MQGVLWKRVKRSQCVFHTKGGPVQPLVESPDAILPSDEQAEVIDFIERLRSKGRGATVPTARIVDADGSGVPIPDSMFTILVQVAEALKAGLAVTVAPHHLTLSTQEAADLLRISRTTLVRLLESGAIPFDKPSRHRKVRLRDLIEYRERQRKAATQALDDMVADAERLGLYDEDPKSVTAALRAARDKNH